MAYNFYIEFKKDYRGYIKGVKYGICDIDENFYYVPQIGSYMKAEALPKAQEGELFRTGEILRRP